MITRPHCSFFARVSRMSTGPGALRTDLLCTYHLKDVNKNLNNFLALTFLFNQFQGNSVLVKFPLKLLKFPGLLV